MRAHWLGSPARRSRLLIGVLLASGLVAALTMSVAGSTPTRRASFSVNCEGISYRFDDFPDEIEHVALITIGYQDAVIERFAVWRGTTGGGRIAIDIRAGGTIEIRAEWRIEDARESAAISLDAPICTTTTSTTAPTTSTTEPTGTTSPSTTVASTSTSTTTTPTSTTTTATSTVPSTSNTILATETSATTATTTTSTSATIVSPTPNTASTTAITTTGPTPASSADIGAQAGVSLPFTTSPEKDASAPIEATDPSVAPRRSPLRAPTRFAATGDEIRRLFDFGLIVLAVGVALLIAALETRRRSRLNESP